MKNLRAVFFGLSIIAAGLIFTGCSTTKHTEQVLSEAGFRRVLATTPAQCQRVESLPLNKLTVAKLNGKKFYVFPDPANKLLYVGNLEEYQSYQQLLTYYNLSGQNRVETSLGDEGAADDTVRWADWIPKSGWTGGGY
jgi:hypothetical protein